MKKHFLSNKHFHYFVINCPISVTLCIELGCTQHADEDSLYSFIAKAQESDVDALYDTAFELIHEDGQYQMTDCRGMYGDVELKEGESIEHWIAQYQL